jgi:hypothetical protein
MTFLFFTKIRKNEYRFLIYHAIARQIVNLSHKGSASAEAEKAEVKTEV